MGKELAKRNDGVTIASILGEKLQGENTCGMFLGLVNEVKSRLGFVGSSAIITELIVLHREVCQVNHLDDIRTTTVEIRQI